MGWHFNEQLVSQGSGAINLVIDFLLGEGEMQWFLFSLCFFYKQLATGVPFLTRFSFPSVFLNVLVGVKVNSETCVRVCVTGADENGALLVYAG